MPPSPEIVADVARRRGISRRQLEALGSELSDRGAPDVFVRLITMLDNGEQRLIRPEDEQLLTLDELAATLGVHRRSLYAKNGNGDPLAQLRARGLQSVTVGQHRRFLRSSVNHLIRTAGASGSELCIC